MISEFLQQLDGIGSGTGVFVLGATNLPDEVDPAILRPDRLGRMIEIPLPTIDNRQVLSVCTAVGSGSAKTWIVPR
jgi:SpoVK/Ycf46/Vps4 family AAA+-type ATPase